MLTQKQIFPNYLVIRCVLEVLGETVANAAVYFFLGFLEDSRVLDVDGEYQSHDVEIAYHVSWAELVLLFNNPHHFLALQRLDQLSQPAALRAQFSHSKINSLDEDCDDVVGFVLGDVYDGQIHTASRPLLQFIHERQLSSHENHCNILFDIAIEPFEEVVENSLLSALESQYICIFNHQKQLFFPIFFELFVQTLQIESGLVDNYVLCYYSLSQEGSHLAGEALQKQGICFGREAVDGYGFKLRSIGVGVFEMSEPGEVAFLPTAGRPHQNEAIPPDFGFQLLDLVAQGHEDIDLLVVLAHIFYQLIDYVEASRRPRLHYFHLHCAGSNHLLIMRQN